MTKDEAIRILKNAAWLGSNDEREATEEAVDMAVDVLRDCDKCAMASINAITLLQNTIKEQWIPCSERLPEIEREGQRRGWYITTNGYGCVSLTQYEFYHDFLKTGWQSDIQIIAWMPLPEPYKGGAE